MIYFVKLMHFKSRLFSIKMIEFKEYDSDYPMKLFFDQSSSMITSRKNGAAFSKLAACSRYTQTS